MTRLVKFFKTTALGGLLVILPATIVFLVFRWLYTVITDAIEPMTKFLMERSSIIGALADLIVIGFIFCFCFVIGLAIKTGVGTFLREKMDELFIKLAPGYRITKQTVWQLIGKEKSLFSSVALVQIFENSTTVTAFVTDEHPDGRFTVFVPTGPNPTSGQIFHVEGRYVHPVKVGIDEAMRSIISCGAGSGIVLQSVKSVESN